MIGYEDNEFDDEPGQYIEEDQTRLGFERNTHEFNSPVKEHE